MKKLLLVFLLFFSADASAQQYRKFLFGFDLGAPTGKSVLIGSFTLEPGLRVRDNLLVGFRMEVRGVGSSSMGASSESLGSFGINGHYYLNQSSVRPFFGFGLGLYNPGNNFLMNSTESMNQRNGFGFYPRVGLEVGHARLMLEYNIIQPMKYYVSYDVPTVSGHYENFNLNYFSLKIGVLIGGGKKKTN